MCIHKCTNIRGRVLRLALSACQAEASATQNAARPAEYTTGYARTLNAGWGNYTYRRFPEIVPVPAHSSDRDRRRQRR